MIREYYPWSHILTGTQGKDPGYDPLQIMVEMAHEAGLEMHAWMNPLRIHVGPHPLPFPKTIRLLLGKRMRTKRWIVETDAAYFITRLMRVYGSTSRKGPLKSRNYDVDGIHFDDYFYPTEDDNFDEEQYAAYKKEAASSGEALTLQEWRCANINALVSLVYQKIKEANSAVMFGIAPQGNIQNDLTMGADVGVWCKARGYVDYICPQSYVNFENKALPFGNCAEDGRRWSPAKM